MLGARGRNRANDLVGVGIEDLDTLIGIDEGACDPHLLVAHGLRLNIHLTLLPVHLIRLRAASKTSKFRRRCPGGSAILPLTIIGTRSSVSPPCERSGSVNPERSCRSRLVPSTLCLDEIA